MHTVTFWPVLVAAIAAFIVSALWYSPILFGKEWMALTKMSAADMAAAKAKGVWKLYVVQFIVSLVTFGVLAFLVGSSSAAGASDGAFLGFIAWLGFIATALVGGMLWEKKTFKLILIQGVCTLLTLVIGGAIIGGWR